MLLELSSYSVTCDEMFADISLELPTELSPVLNNCGYVCWYILQLLT